MELIELVTVHGPLALGWVLYVSERNNHNKTRDKVMDAFVADTTAKGMLQATVDRLIAIIQAK